MVNAAATAALVALAPNRVAVAFGTGFSGRRAMGYRAIPWAYMDAYIRAYRALRRGETIEWEGALMRMLHPPSHGAPRPVEVPILISALGPKEAGVAHELADGLFATLTLARVRQGVLVGVLSLLGHGARRWRRSPLRAGASGRRAWTRARLPRRLRVQLAAVQASGRDGVGGGRRAHGAQRAPLGRPRAALRRPQRRRPRCVGRWRVPLLEQATVSGTADQVAARLSELEAGGVTELVFQPCGPDIRRELATFMETARATVAA